MIFLSWEKLGYRLILRELLIHGFENGSRLGDVERFSIGGGVVDIVSVYTLVGSGVGGWVMIGSDRS